MPNPIDFKNTSLFNYFWKDDGTGLAHRGLDEVTPEGAAKLKEYALKHNFDGTPSPTTEQKIDAKEKATMKAILDDDHYGRFFELDARPQVFIDFDIDPGEVHSTAVNHPVSAGNIEIPEGVSRTPAVRLANVHPDQLAKEFSKEYRQRRREFENSNLSVAQRGIKTLGLLKSYADALWANGEKPETENAGHALLDAYEKLPYAAEFGFKDYNGAGWNAAQSLVLGLNPNSFPLKFPDASPTADTTHLSMNDKMAKAMSFVDQYREAKGLEKKAEAFEKKSPLGFMIGEESGHYKRGNLTESTPFSSSGLNWGKVLFPNDKEIAELSPAKDFEFPIDCLDAFKNFVRVNPKRGDHMIIKDKDGNILQAKKVINRDSDGKPESWQATFTNQQGATVEPSEVIGLLVDSNGRVKGDGTSEGSQNMWWWGFCDRNTAQRLYKSKFQIPDLDVDVVKIKVGNQTIEIPQNEAQKLIDADVPDIVTGETYCGFRWNDEPQVIVKKSGERIEGRIKDLSLEAGPGATRIKADYISIHDAPGRPMLGTIKVGEESIDVKDIERVERKANEKQVTVFTKSNPDTPISGKLSSPIKWSAATRQGDRQVINQTDDFPIRGEVEISTSYGKDLRVSTSDISNIIGETQQDMRISQYTTWVSQNKGMYATDASLGIVVSNGMRWVNKIDIDVQTGDERPPGAPKVELKGIEGPMKRQAGDKLLWINGRYAYRANSDANSSNFRGWVQVNKTGRIINEGFVAGAPDFGWSATGPLDWNAKSSFNPYMDA
ncbi:MAG: hypothetical protein VYC39_10330, partial [Myxococcota bacterium]|nr:hypothetical protein [Myxococcota bacterium]